MQTVEMITHPTTVSGFRHLAVFACPEAGPDYELVIIMDYQATTHYAGNREFWDMARDACRIAHPIQHLAQNILNKTVDAIPGLLQARLTVERRTADQMFADTVTSEWRKPQEPGVRIPMARQQPPPPEPGQEG